MAVSIPQGYKQTEAGVIPEDWDCVAMGDLGESLIGLTYHPSDVREYGTLVLRSSNIQNGKLAFKDNVFVDMDLPKRVIVKTGDILICVRNGSRKLIGKCAIINPNIEGSAFGAFMSVYRSSFSSFIFYQFQADIIQKQIEEVMGATINQITNKDLSKFQIPFPQNEKEQTAIANALSDADVWIQSLTRLIAKKRQIKQGAMQRLLNPYEDGGLKKGWHATVLGELSVKISSGKTKSSDSIGDFPLFGSTGVIGSCRDYEYSGEAILVARVGANAGALRSVNGRYGVSDNTIILKIKESIDSLYIEFFLKKYDLNRLVFGSGQPLITGSQLSALEVKMPADKSEQTRIATILSNMDNEITQLETKLTKAKTLKQGMMQNLLTGKIRLVEPQEVNHAGA